LFFGRLGIDFSGRLQDQELDPGRS